MSDSDDVTLYIAGGLLIVGSFVVVSRALRRLGIEGPPALVTWFVLPFVLTFLVFTAYYYAKARLRTRSEGRTSD